ncbi:MAG TPA: right-handed parallel beta-helix repeat-containing protein, partial [Phycisphaeraceae bacterium]
MARLLLRLTGCRGLLIGGLLLIASSAFAEAVRYVAPAAKGEGTGQDAQNAAAYLNEAFWQEVQGLLAQGPVTVRFLDGVYSGPELNLNGVGHDQHRLTLRGDTSDGAVFSGDTNWYIRLRGSHHITFTDLHFRGPVRSFPIHMQELGSRDRPSHHIRIEDCTFTDMHTVVYGALGVVNGSHHITVRGCTFRGVGLDGRAHMAYNTHGAHHLYYYDNIFEDCTGEYVRFRNGCEHVEVARNIFRSTEPKYNSPFVSMPLFNDVNPGDEI